MTDFCRYFTHSGGLCGNNTVTIRPKGLSGRSVGVNDEISVAELLVREGWGDSPPPASSRWRVVAVMLAVVIGCGAAAVLVAFGGKTRQDDASPVDQIQVIPFPQRTTGLGGADQATDSPSDGGIGGGTGGDVVTAAGEHRGTVTEVPGRTPTSQSSSDTGTGTPTTPTTTTDLQPPGGSVTTTTPPAGGHPSTPTPKPPQQPPKPTTCFLIICW